MTAPPADDDTLEAEASAVARLLNGADPNDYRLASRACPDYNCLAWALADQARNWQPRPMMMRDGAHWPPGIPMRTDLATLRQLLGVWGFERAVDGTLDNDLVKVALYDDRDQPGRWSHVARQLADGWWASKLGRLADIEHRTVHVLEPLYGPVVGFLARPRAGLADPIPRQPWPRDEG